MLQDVMRGISQPLAANPTNWSRLTPTQKQALTVIADKIARVLTGDPDYADNWHDIQGYAKLVEDRLGLERKPLSPYTSVLVASVSSARG